MSIPQNKQPQDAIIAEVRAIREELAAEHDYDVDRIYEAIKRREAASERPVVEMEPKRVTPVAS